jgi:class 3 adenylate cyclase
MTSRRERWRTVPISLALGAAFVIVIAASFVTLYLLLEKGRESTADLINERTTYIINGIQERINNHLRPVSDQSYFISHLIQQEQINPNNDDELSGRLISALAATPQVSELAFIRPDLQQIRVEQNQGNVSARTIDMQDIPGISEALEASRTSGKQSWGNLVWSEERKQPLINLRTPVWYKGEFSGVIFATVSIKELSGFLANTPEKAGSNNFILFDRDYVLAHRQVARPQTTLIRTHPLLEISNVADPILAAIWSPATRKLPIISSGANFDGHTTDINGVTYAYIYRTLTDFGREPWLIGTYFPLSELDIEARRLETIAWLSLGILAVAILISWLIGLAVGRPVKRLASATAAIRNLDLTAVKEFERYRLREVDEAGQAYNSLIQAMRWFENYVPKKLVHRLMAQGSEAANLHERDMTILFTDIVGFSSLSERITPPEIASFLNNHFQLLASCVEGEDGTIDKYIGDSVMAFWGAPLDQPDHAQRAVRAARAIRIALGKDNEDRRRQGVPPIRVRVGLHSGPVMVGNIGAPGRINYTVVGDNVNTAQRLESLGKKFMSNDEDIFITLSQETFDAVGGEIEVESLGLHSVPGKNEALAVYKLL